MSWESQLLHIIHKVRNKAVEGQFVVQWGGKRGGGASVIGGNLSVTDAGLFILSQFLKYKETGDMTHVAAFYQCFCESVQSRATLCCFFLVMLADAVVEYLTHSQTHKQALVSRILTFEQREVKEPGGSCDQTRPINMELGQAWARATSQHAENIQGQGS